MTDNLEETSTRIVYIAGRMHCGSTFLNVLLGSSAFSIGLGEPVNGINRGPNEYCSCGKSITTCPFWSEVIREFETASGRNIFESVSLLYRYSDIRKFLSAYLSNVDILNEKKIKEEKTNPDSPWQEYARLHTILMESISKISHKPVLIDASKEYTRGLMSLKSDPRTLLIHLVRSPVATVASYYWRQTQGSRFYFMKHSYDIKWFRYPALMLVAVSWTVGLLASILIQMRFRSRVLHVSYEQFCSDPMSELKRIARFIGIDLSDVIDGVKKRRSFPNDHNLAGNTEVKSDGSFTFIPNIKGRRKLPFLYRLGSIIFAAPGLLIRRSIFRGKLIY